MAKNIVSGTFIFGAIILCAIGYVFYRYEKASDYLRIGSARDIPASICTFDASSFTGSGRGAIYIYDGRVRVEIEFREGAISSKFRIFVDRDGVQYVDPSIVTTTTPESFERVARVLTENEWTCSPWWFPDESLVQIPDSILENES